jgi:hypothetical protein
MRAARGTLVLGLCCFAGFGCGASEKDQVQAKVKQFLKATAAKDPKTLCDQVLAPSLIGRLSAGGITCTKAMQIFVSSVQSPTLAIGRINVNGQTASAITLTGARGQQGSLDAIQLVKTPQGWRVAGLGAPVLPPGAPGAATAPGKVPPETATSVQSGPKR